MRELLTEAAARAADYIEEIQVRTVAPSPEAVAGLAQLDEPMPETPTAPNEVLETLDERGSDATMAMTGPRFFGFVIGGSLPVVLAANWLAGAWDQCSSYYKAMPATSYIEQVALRWILELFHLPPATGAVL